MWDKSRALIGQKMAKQFSVNSWGKFLDIRQAGEQASGF